MGMPKPRQPKPSNGSFIVMSNESMKTLTDAGLAFDLNPKAMGDTSLPLVEIKRKVEPTDAR